MTTPIERLPNLLGALSLGVTDRVSDRMETVASVSSSACAALFSIRTRPGTSVLALASVVGLSHSATVRVVDQLVARGWVARARGASDARQLSLRLTPQGVRMTEELVEARRASLATILDGMSYDEIDLLEGLVVKLLTALPRDREQARHICRVCDHSGCVGEDCPVGSAVRD